MRDVHRAAEVPVKHKSAVFVILTPRRTFTVQAKSVAEMQEWLQAINQAKVQSDFMASTSDLESFAGSTLQLELGLSSPPTSPTTSQQLPLTPAQTSSSQQSAATQHKAMARQSISDVILARRQPPNTQLSLADQELHDKREASSTRNKGKNVVRPLSVAIATGASAAGSAPHTDTSILDRPAPRRAGSRRAAGEGLSLITTGTQAIQIATPSSPRMEQVHTYDPNLGSFSSGQSYTGTGGAVLSAVPMTPSSPGYNSGGEFFWNTGNDPGFSSGDEECADEEEDRSVVVEAGRVATEANAPGSGIVTGEQLESKVVRSGNLLKLGNKYKVCLVFIFVVVEVKGCVRR